MTHLPSNSQSESFMVPELLAPAGNRAALLAALANGANAVYLGTQDFNARLGASNFALEELREICDLVHLAGARVYLTLNTVILPSEFASAVELARQAWYAGADALIVADLGLLNSLARELPELELHASTQLNTHNTLSLRWLAAVGAARVTLARELALPEIAELSSAHIPLEVFAHGALCFCYSGQCLMSSLIGQRSANRGRCAQPCRLPYQLIDTSTGRRIPVDGDRLLSPLDLNTIEQVDELCATGIAALKIEGRMKNADYVATATAAYRAALDAQNGTGEAKIVEQKEALTRAYSRGFTNAYLNGEQGNTMMGYRRSAGRSAPNDEPSPIWNSDALFQANQGFVSLNAAVTVRIGQPLALRLSEQPGGSSVTVYGPVVEHARARMLTCDDLTEHIGRVGATPFAIDSWDINLDEGAGLSFSVLHNIRREALELLTEQLLEAWHSRRLERSALRRHEQLPPARRGTPFVATLVRDKAAAKTARKAGSDAIYQHFLSFSCEQDEALDNDKTIMLSKGLDGNKSRNRNRSAEGKLVEGTQFWLSSILHDNEVAAVQHALTASLTPIVNNLGELALACKLEQPFEVGPALPSYNQATLELYAASGAQRVWLGAELSLRDLEELAPTSPIPLGITVLGAQELMVSEHCILQAQGDCNRECSRCPRRKSPRLLEDRKGYRFPVRTDNAGRSHLYNAMPLDIVSELPKLLALGITGFLVDCTLLNTAQTTETVARAARACRLAANGTGFLPKSKDTTTGHLFRGVL